jgi:hypothetical protein
MLTDILRQLLKKLKLKCYKQQQQAQAQQGEGQDPNAAFLQAEQMKGTS